jgi:hypothetical protein
MGYGPDGQTWTTCGATQITMGPTVYVGLAVSNVDATQLATAVFDQVAITEGTPANQPPTVILTAPANGATFGAPATIAMAATAADPENRLARVEFYAGSALLGADTTAPFTFSWTNVAAGTYSLTAVAHDSDGAQATAAPVTVTVSTSPPPSTWRVLFTASTDHDSLVTSYLLEVFAGGADPNTATAIASSDLGKPTPDDNREIDVDRTAFFGGLSAGSYVVTVAAVGAGGTSRGEPVTFTR